MVKKLLTTLLLSLNILCYSQEFEVVDVVVWEAEARSGGKFIGVSPDQFEAQYAIEELRFIKEGTKYHINHSEINVRPVLISKSKSIKEDFISESASLELKYISEIELIALEYMADNDIETAISFYTNVVREKNKDLAKKHLKNLERNYAKYLFEHETPAAIVTSSE